jgi:hypothetical protein
MNPQRTGTNFTFQFETLAGVAYRVSRKPSLASSGPWSMVLNTNGNGFLMTATDSSATNASGVYRVEF